MRLCGKKKQKRSNIGFWLSDSDAYNNLCVPGYTTLANNPEVMTACRRIAELIGSITIHIMENTERGDVRIINQLSNKIDINPNQYMTRKTFIEAVVMNLILYGDGNSVVKVHTQDGMLGDMEPVSADKVTFIPDGNYGYKVLINGVPYNPDELLHFVYNPDRYYPWKGQGVRVQLKDVANNLKQAAATEKGFLSDKWKPSLIIKVDANNEEFSNPKSRDEFLDDYIATSESGKPWVIPAEMMDIQQIKPLSLNDLAINDSIQLNKRTIASILGVPPFILGVGEYDKDAWNAFVNTTVKPIVIGIQQEMSKKLIISPKWYVRFNVLSLLDWDIKTIADVFGSLSDRGFVTGNEVRDRIGMSPADGLDEFRILENYIPYDMSAMQKKLVQKEE